MSNDSLKDKPIKTGTLKKDFGKIKVNKAKCLLCGDVIESTKVHHFTWCSCGNLAVDGGKSYIKRGFKTEDWEELSEYD